MEQATTTFIVLKELAGHPSPHLDALQKFLMEHMASAQSFWFAVWFMTGVVLLAKLWYEYKDQQKER